MADCNPHSKIITHEASNIKLQLGIHLEASRLITYFVEMRSRSACILCTHMNRYFIVFSFSIHMVAYLFKFN